MEMVLAVLAVVVLVGAVTLARAIKIVPVHHVGAVERLGRYQRLVEPGMHLVVPYIDVVHRMDTRERTVSLTDLEVITTDNMILSVRIDLRYRIVDPYKVRYEVQDVPTAVNRVVETHLRTAIGDMDLGEARSSAHRVQSDLSEGLRETTRAWGVEVSELKLKDLTPRRTVGF